MERQFKVLWKFLGKILGILGKGILGFNILAYRVDNSIENLKRKEDPMS